ncbi:MAG: hypothetical protein WBB27_11585 [Maribacter sp.]
MFDNFRASVYDIEERNRLWSFSKLEFHDYQKKSSKYDKRGFTIKESKQLDGVIFSNFKDRLDILVFPHKMKNLGIHNADAFSMEECMNTLKNFFNQLPISDYSLYKIRSLEAGVNFIVDGYGEDLITNTQWWKRTRFRHHDNLGYSKTAFSVDKTGKANTHLILKFYLKYIMAPNYCKPDTLRFELKSRKAAYFKNKLKIDTLEDLFTVTPYMHVKKEIFRTVGQITILEQDFDDSSLPEKDKIFLRTYSNPLQWDKIFRAQKNKFARYRSKYLKILDRTGFNIHRGLLKAVDDKLNELTLPLSTKSVENFPPRITAFSDQENPESVDYFPIDKREIFPTIDLSNHYCAITNIRLLCEGPVKKGEGIPKYIRTNTIEFLKERDPDVYTSLLHWLVPKIKNKGYKLPKSAKSLNGHLCHVIRNRYASQMRRGRKECDRRKGTSSGRTLKRPIRSNEIEIISKYINQLIIR